MTLLVTFPGRAGDLLWALPTIRALSRRLGQPLDLQICGEFAGLVPLLEQQPYLSRVVADPNWGMSQGWQPPNREDVISPYASTLHLGYRRWPELGLAQETLATFNGHKLEWIDPLLESELDLQTPWITVADPKPNTAWLCGFSECYFELKYGLFELLTLFAAARLPDDIPDRPMYSWETGCQGPLSICGGARWEQEAGHGGCSWLEGAQWLASTRAFLGCCSGWHVLAVAMGVPVVLYEPMEARHNPIFYPLGWDGPQVTRVVGLDGTWTTDARHTAETIERVLGRKDR